jgi:hypothetical protein
MFGPPGRNAGAPESTTGRRHIGRDPQIEVDPLPTAMPAMPRQVATGMLRRIDVIGIFDNLSAIPPHWRFDRVSLDIFVTA